MSSSHSTFTLRKINSQELRQSSIKALRSKGINRQIKEFGVAKRYSTRPSQKADATQQIFEDSDLNRFTSTSDYSSNICKISRYKIGRSPSLAVLIDLICKRKLRDSFFRIKIGFTGKLNLREGAWTSFANFDSLNLIYTIKVIATSRIEGPFEILKKRFIPKDIAQISHNQTGVFSNKKSNMSVDSNLVVEKEIKKVKSKLAQLELNLQKSRGCASINKERRSTPGFDSPVIFRARNGDSIYPRSLNKQFGVIENVPTIRRHPTIFPLQTINAAKIVNNSISLALLRFGIDSIRRVSVKIESIQTIDFAIDRSIKRLLLGRLRSYNQTIKLKINRLVMVLEKSYLKSLVRPLSLIRSCSESKRLARRIANSFKMLSLLDTVYNSTLSRAFLMIRKRSSAALRIKLGADILHLVHVTRMKDLFRSVQDSVHRDKVRMQRMVDILGRKFIVNERSSKEQSFIIIRNFAELKTRQLNSAVSRIHALFLKHAKEDIDLGFRNILEEARRDKEMGRLTKMRIYILDDLVRRLQSARIRCGFANLSLYSIRSTQQRLSQKIMSPEFLDVIMSKNNTHVEFIKESHYSSISGDSAKSIEPDLCQSEVFETEKNDQTKQLSLSQTTTFATYSYFPPRKPKGKKPKPARSMQTKEIRAEYELSKPKRKKSKARLAKLTNPSSLEVSKVISIQKSIAAYKKKSLKEDTPRAQNSGLIYFREQLTSSNIFVRKRLTENGWK